MNQVSPTIERNSWRIYGCGVGELMRLNGERHPYENGSPAHCYRQQRLKAKVREIQWLLTFPQWMKIWQESGLFHLRGSGRGFYCMARRGDIGPYIQGNVYIEEFSRNASDGKTLAKKRSSLCKSVFA